MKRLIAILLLLCLLPLPGLAFQKGFGEFAKDQVNLRKEPGGDILFRKEQGEELFILAQKERGGQTWYQVETFYPQRGRPAIGWVLADMVKGPEALFSNIVQIAAYDRNLIALRRDGSVVFAGDQFNYPQQREGQDPATWQGVVQVAMGSLTCYGLKQDGSLYRFGIRGPASGIRGVPGTEGQNIPFVSIDAQDDVLLGQMADGSLRQFWTHGGIDLLLPPGSEISDFAAWMPYYGIALAVQGGRVRSLSGPQGLGVFSQEGQDRIAAWQDVIQVVAGFKTPDRVESHQDIGSGPMVAAILKGGSVVALDPDLNREVGAWADIIKIVSGNGFLLGLTRQGQVLAAGPMKHLVAEDIRTWSGITDIAAGYAFCAGVTAEGGLLFAGEARFHPS